MKKLDYSDWCNIFARRCKICAGAKCIKKDGINYICSCQIKATIKYRFEQIDVIPNHLKYKDWSDFTGVISDGSLATGKLTTSSALSARKKALEYCFSIPTIAGSKNRIKNLIIDTRVSSGKNVVISGDKGSGRTLIASLILKEVAWSSAIKNLDLSFQWVKSSNFIDAARWDNEHRIDYEYLMHLQSIKFLAIDGVDNFSEYGHTSPPDIITMNSFFAQRRISGMPLILVCSSRFFNMLNDSKYHLDIKRTWGEEFLSLSIDPVNVFIELEKE